MYYSIVRPTTKYYKNKIGYRYYKYDTWTQPILTSNNSSSLMQVNVSSFVNNLNDYNGWASFKATTNDAKCWCSDPSDSLPTMDIVFNKRLLIKSITVKNRSTTYSFTENYELQGSNDGVTWQNIYNGTCTNFNALSTWTLFSSNSNDIVYSRLRIITKSVYGENYACIGFITINALDSETYFEVTSSDDYDFTESYTYVEEVTSSDDYDFTKEVLMPYSILNNENHYTIMKEGE